MADEPQDYSDARRRVLLSLASSLTLAACGGGGTPSSSSSGSSSGSTPPPRLRLSGSDILSPEGTPLTLRGWNWGRWGITQPSDAQANYEQGARCVRIPLRWWGYYEGPYNVDSRDDAQTTTAGIDQGHLDILDAMVRQASQAKLWIILFIDSDCGQDGTQDGEPAYCDPHGNYPNGHNFWTDPGVRARFINVWKFIAARYKDTPYLGFFEPLPEPNPTASTQTDITAFYDEVMMAIRTVAPGVPFLLGPRLYHLPNSGAAYNSKWTDVVYTGDLFLHTGGTQDENIADLGRRLQYLLDLRDHKQVPIFIQQCGVESGDDPDLAYLNAMLTLLTDKGVGYTYWEYRDTFNPNSFGPIYQDGHGGWITKQTILDTISGYLKH